MCAKQRFMSAMRRGRVDRPAAGSATSVATTDLMDEAGAHFPEAHLDAEAMMRLAIAGHTVLGYDNVMPLFSVWHEASALGCPVNWGGPEIMPDCREHICREPEDIRIPDDLPSRPGCKVALDGIALLRKELGDEVCVMGKVFGAWTLGYDLFGTQEFLIDTMLNPDKIKRIIEKLKEVSVMFGKAQIEAGADCLCFADHATRDLCSPDAYREFLKDVHAELVERIPCPMALHICGDTSDRLGMIAETGFACFHYDSKTGDETARALAGETMGLMGGSNNPELVRRGPREEIFVDVERKIAAGIDIIGPECAAPLDAPWRNLRHFSEAVQHYSHQT